MVNPFVSRLFRMKEFKNIICQCTNLASAIYFDMDIEKEVNNLQQKLFSDEVQLG